MTEAPYPEPEGEPPHFPVPEEVAEYAPEELSPSLAAVCFALNRPVTVAEAAAILGRSRDDVTAAADHLAGSLRGGGLMLQRHQDEIQLVTRPEVAWAVQRALNPEKPGRLSRAALETLAIVAYRQPLTRAGIEAIRGVNCEAVLDSLERRGLIVEVGRQDSPGHPRLFGTTLRFLQVVGLERIEDLPPLPEGLVVPELPAGDWEAEAEAEPAAAAGEPIEQPAAHDHPPAPGEPGEPGEEEPTVEVRGAPVEPSTDPAAPPAPEPTPPPARPAPDPADADTGHSSNGHPHPDSHADLTDDDGPADPGGGPAQP